MKKSSFLVLFTVIFVTMPVLSFGQDTTINENSKKEKKISYSFINEYGFCMGKYFEGDRGLLRKGAKGVFVNGIRFNKTQDEIGIGLGIEWLVFSQTYPIYFNYRHYFLSKTQIKPLINVAVGTRLGFWQNHEPDWMGNFDTKIYCSTGLYSTISTGFKVKAFSFTAGFLIRSWGFDDFFGGGEINVGFTF